MTSVFKISFALAAISSGTWVDICCLAIVAGFAYFDAIKGFSNTLAVLLGLLIATHAGYWLYPSFNTLVAKTSFAKAHSIEAAVLPYAIAVIVGILIFIIIRLCFRRFFKLLVEQPADRVLGAISGIIKGLLVVMIVFSGISLIPKSTAIHRIFCEESITGRTAFPILQTVLAQKPFLGAKKEKTR